jgi:urea carboxylase
MTGSEGYMFKKILIANRGAIAVRIERTLKKLGIRSVAVYTHADQDSLHVENADEAVCIGDGPVKDSYLMIDKIVQAALDTGAEAIHPGYGFLSENTKFAAECQANGIVFIGPQIKQIEIFGLKHLAREMAKKVGVPLLPGTGILHKANEAVVAAEKIGYPVILKSTAGGGGIGMRICVSAADLQHNFVAVRHLATANFNDDGVFIEKYITSARHIEVQIFGNSAGEIVTLGERDCSVQRRNQKVMEESPAPNVPQTVKKAMYAAAKKLASTVGYRSAGTVEFLYDNVSQAFYFLEVNTRLQVEHGITEEVCGIDLVEWMVREAAGELNHLTALVPEPQGHSIEARIYAEDCANDFRPSTGKIDAIVMEKNIRVETWVRDGIQVSSLYDPMLAKLIVHGHDRADAVRKMTYVLNKVRYYGIATNSEYLSALVQTQKYKNGELSTSILKGFHPQERALEVLDGGVQATVQDEPGRIGYWGVGVPPSGAMDAYDFCLGNAILGNAQDAAGIELTLRGGSYKFRTAMDFCLTGADMQAVLDGEVIKRYTVIHAETGQVLMLGKAETGLRSYLTIAGGLDVAKFMGSTATFVSGNFGGHGGRELKVGDVIRVNHSCVIKRRYTLQKKYWPELTKKWTIGVIAGPHCTEEFLQPEYLETLTTSEYEVNFNSARTGVRLNGPIPQWTRMDGGEAGLHPSNIHDNAYAIGALDLTGDQAVLLGPDGPSLGGFVCSVCTASSELWKLGQLHPGDKVRFRLLSLEQAKIMREKVRANIIAVEEGKKTFSIVKLPVHQVKTDSQYAILLQEKDREFSLTIRCSGDEYILVEYGEMELNIEARLHVHLLMQKLEKRENLAIIDITPGIRSIQLHFDADKIDSRQLARLVQEIDHEIKDLDNITVSSRIVRLPLSWDDEQTRIAAERYQKTVRPNAPWCPSNPEFIRRINGLESIDDVKRIVFDASYLVLGLGDVYLGAPVAVPLDPRHRMVTTKYNPARPWTPENAVGIGGTYLCVYGMEGPGGYQFVGRTVQMWNSLMATRSFEKGKPWLLRFFDQIQFYPVSHDKLIKMREDFLRGRFDVEIRPIKFDLHAYKNFLDNIHESAVSFKEHQEDAFEVERIRWQEQGLDSFVSEAVKESIIAEDDIPENCERVIANMPGSVWKIVAELGASIKKGEDIAILESMKMEFPIKASCSGILENVYIKVSEQISAGHIVACIRP